MNKAHRLFQAIMATLIAAHEGVCAGRMMSSPALRYGGRVFAFFHQDEMIFKLGRDFDPKTFGVRHHAPLQPFKTKGPLLDWFQVPFAESARWEALAREALRRMAVGASAAAARGGRGQTRPSTRRPRDRALSGSGR